MTRRKNQNWIATALLAVLAAATLLATTGCDEYVAAGDFVSPFVEAVDPPASPVLPATAYGVINFPSGASGGPSTHVHLGGMTK